MKCCINKDILKDEENNNDSLLTDETIDECKWDEEVEQIEKNKLRESNLKTQELKDLELKQKTENILIIQRIYRGCKLRKLMKNELDLIYKNRKEFFSLNKQKTIYFKDNWDFYFPKFKYDFSFQGIRALEKNISSFYDNFFKNDSQIITEGVKNNEVEEITLDSTKFKVEGIEKIKTYDEFKEIFKNYFIYQMCDILELSLDFLPQKYNFELCNIKNINNTIKKFNLSRPDSQNKTNNPNKNINDKHFPTYKLKIEKIQEYEKMHCIAASLLDNNKVYYLGSVKENSNIKYGLGKEYFIEAKPNQTRYKYYGYFKDDLYEGLGIYINEKKEAYFGEYRDGKKHGYGLENTPNLYYEGFYFQDIKEGYGKLQTKKFTYIGNFHNGLFGGFGLLNENNSTSCFGYFIKGKLNGIGYFKWEKGQSYYGEWKDGKMNGYGKYTYNNGDIYEGYYKDDLKDGKGTYYFSSGSKLIGIWSKGLKQGIFDLIIYEDNNNKRLNESYMDKSYDKNNDNPNENKNDNIIYYKTSNKVSSCTKFTLKYKDDVRIYDDESEYY